jgi:hypothetical protein
MAAPAVECVLKNVAKTVGEGPHWDDITNTLLHVDIQENSIHRFNPATGVDDKIKLGEKFTAFIFVIVSTWHSIASTFISAPFDCFSLLFLSSSSILSQYGNMIQWRI